MTFGSRLEFRPWRPAAALALALIGLAGLGPQDLMGRSGQTPQEVSTAPVVPSAGQPNVAAAKQDSEFERLVREWTTRPEFLSPLVDHLPLAPGIPSPKDVVGHHVGAPGVLTPYADLVRYYRALAAATPRVKVLPIGETDEGREAVVVFVGAEQSIAQLENNRLALARLADPRTLGEDEARALIAGTRPLYHLMGGLHSGETGPPEMLMELAYRLAVEDSPLIRQIRENLIVSITPAAEPDGRDRYVDWYHRHLTGITDPREMVGPPYWGKYVFHDNNRDINYSQKTMRTLLDWYLQWHPPIVHDLHESVPFLYTFSGQAPQNPNLDPILYTEQPWFAHFEVAQLTKYGMPGVWTHAFVDMWSPGYLAFMASNHNGLVRMYETFGNGGATTMRRKVEEPREGALGGPTQFSREWYRPVPAYKDVQWSMRNNTNYMQTAVLSGLQLASAFPQVVLENFYLKSRNAIAAGRDKPPHGYIVPSRQRDMTRVARLVELLRVQGIEVGRAAAPFKTGDRTYPAGSYVVKLDQPYGRLAKTLLEKQVFPDQNLRTYDDTAWTLGLMLDADVAEINDKAILDVPVHLVDRADEPGAFKRTGRAWIAVAHNGSNNLVSLRYRFKNVAMQGTERAFSRNGLEFPAGSLIVQASQVDAGQFAGAVESLGLVGGSFDGTLDVKTHDVDLPRLAVYSTWGSTQNVGWVRHGLDQFGVPYDLIYKERLKDGGLRAAYDVIVIPSQGRGGKALVFDVASKGRAFAYTRTDRFKTLGTYGSSEDITGGMGLTGVLELDRFVNAGGLLVTLGEASSLPPEFGLTRSIDAARPSAQFYAPGPIVSAEVRAPAHPVFYGYSKTTLPVRYAPGPRLQVPEPDRARQVLMEYTGGDAGVLSGLMKGASEIRRAPAIVDVPVGPGRVLLFATNPCYRWQNHAEFNMLFNAIMHFNDFDRGQ